MNRVCILGSSPVALSLAILAAYENYFVDIFEPRRNFGGAWRTAFEPLSSKYIQVYNNIVVPLNAYEQSNFDQILTFLTDASVSITPFEFPAYTHPSYSQYSKYYLDFRSLLRTVQNLPNISFVRDNCYSVAEFVDNAIVNHSREYQKVFLPESLPIDKYSCCSGDLYFEHTTTRSRHLHVGLMPYSRDIRMWSYADAPNFDKAFDRSSVLPLSCSSNYNPLIFQGRVSRDLKNEKLKKIINHSELLHIGDFIYLKQFAYLSKRATSSSIEQFKCLNQESYAKKRVVLFKTHALVESLLDLLSNKETFLA